jgi:hypothetical protein
MIRITQHGTAVDDTQLAVLRGEFRERQCVLVRQLVDPALVSRLLPLLADAPVHERLPGQA